MADKVADSLKAVKELGDKWYPTGNDRASLCHAATVLAPEVERLRKIAADNAKARDAYQLTVVKMRDKLARLSSELQSQLGVMERMREAIVKAPHDPKDCDGTLCGKQSPDCDGCWKVTALSSPPSAAIRRYEALERVYEAAKPYTIDGGIGCGDEQLEMLRTSVEAVEAGGRGS